jgi:HAD superfamily hydrolase (TIGR01509 family)
MAGVRAFLFDWAGTLFYSRGGPEWIVDCASTLGRTISLEEASMLSKAMSEASRHPDVIALDGTEDTSPEHFRTKVLLQFGMAGMESDLAIVMHDRYATVDDSQPYPDAPGVLRRLKDAGARIAVVSDIHRDLRPLFAHFGILDCVDAFIHSFEHGVQKPDPRMFRLALDALGAKPDEALMIGDRAERDGGSIAIGVPALILPRVPDGAARGLWIVERFLG